jgi:integrase
MPRRPDLSWDKKNRRWLKEYRGKKYAVSCRQLREQGYDVLSDTKPGSYIAANAWWARKEFELTAAERPAPRPLHPLEDALLASWGEDPAEGPCPYDELYPIGPDGRIGKEPVAEVYDPEGRQNLATILNVLLPLLGRHFFTGHPLPPRIAELLGPARWQQIEAAFKGLGGEPAAEPEKRLSAHRDRWVATLLNRAAAGGLAPAKVDNDRIALSHFITFAGEGSPVEVVTASLLQRFYDHCLGRVAERLTDPRGKAGWSPDYAKKVHALARTFARHLAEQGLIERPANVDSRAFRFGASAKAVPTWTVAEFQSALKAATGQLRLHLLLMVNCGMTQVDISDLLDSEVDWEAGRISRKRSKTADQKNTPTVEYPLWPETFRLLKEHRSGGDRALLTESGRPWVRTEIQDGELIKADNIASNYVHLKKKLKGFRKPLKQLRKTAASLLEKHPDHSRYGWLFLGHSPRTVKDKHYVHPDQGRVDAAVLWLGQQLGQVE